LSFRRILTTAAVTCGLAVASACGASSDDVWERISRFDFNGVSDELVRRPGLSDREQRLALAVAVLNRQPRTPAWVDDAARQLEALVEEKRDDDAGRWGRFLLARIAQLHRAPANTVAAANHYRALLTEDPTHAAAQRSLLKLAVLLVYDPDVEPDRARGFREAEALATRATHAPERAELRLMLGRAAVFFRMAPAVSAEHFRAALEAGIATPFLRSATQFALGELCRESGNRDLALSSYRSFLEENPRDQRAKLVRERIAELERTTAAR
jgi:tetratricopeptide (TPR) repeat protein